MTDRLELFLRSVQKQRDDTEFMRQIAWTLWIVAIFMLPITAIRQFADERVVEAQEQTQKAAFWVSIAAHCMNRKGSFHWHDDMDGWDKTTFCETVPLAKRN